jgi:hypothetical protein
LILSRCGGADLTGVKRTKSAIAGGLWQLRIRFIQDVEGSGLDFFRSDNDLDVRSYFAMQTHRDEEIAE